MPIYNKDVRNQNNRVQNISKIYNKITEVTLILV
jgi:hypothetical protein